VTVFFRGHALARNPRLPPDKEATAMTKPNDEPVESRDELWDANDVARYLKVSRSWVYYRAEAGLLPCLRVGGLVRFEPATVRAFARGEGSPSRVLPFPVGPSVRSR
jgi:excisionase family DNA binding protein